MPYPILSGESMALIKPTGACSFAFWDLHHILLVPQLDSRRFDKRYVLLIPGVKYWAA